MSINPKNLAIVREEFAQKPIRAQEAAEARRREAERKIPGLKKIDEQISALGIKTFEAAFEYKGAELDKRLNEIKEENLALRKEKARLLKENGFPEDFTKIKYECDRCCDTGFVGGEMCLCMRKRLAQEGFKSSGLGELIKTQGFDSFRLECYSDAPDPKKGCSDRDVMTKILADCREYADNFGPESDCLLFVGQTGLGKTHLSSAIAKTAIEKGFDVVYESAPNAVSLIERDRFADDSEREQKSQRLFDCDLLILDDLGTEISGKNTPSIIYNIINTRLVNRKPTIINTNLNAKELERNYDQRIISRLFGEYRVMLFEGKDVRRAKI